MYNQGDAVARLDSFVITVTGAAPLVGQRKLIRIETVERSAAVAALVDGPPAAEESEDSEDGLESGARRGRRGGRRRSRAGAGDEG
jgi:hypothetical protein